MTFTSRDLEQGYSFQVHNHDWEVIDIEGLHLVRRQSRTYANKSKKPKKGWSNAGRRRRFG
ncbi:hypothetical protein J2S37_000199 [Corynebacterium felinum]|uniref:Uncharacterized protein n=2 Tax=Corynebacterium felinum TaxID=131318 RepID=A0ABU2B5I7_9CORY|nr:hypothetical protein [Corynebacterium felinum]